MHNPEIVQVLDALTNLSEDLSSMLKAKGRSGQRRWTKFHRDVVFFHPWVRGLDEGAIELGYMRMLELTVKLSLLKNGLLRFRVRREDFLETGRIMR